MIPHDRPAARSRYVPLWPPVTLAGRSYRHALRRPAHHESAPNFAPSSYNPPTMRKYLGLIILLAVLGLLALWGVGFYNGSVNLNEDVTKQWSNVENAYQLRADKTKNLLEIVKGAANFEQSTLTQVIEARAKATSVTVDPGDLSPEKIQAFQQAQDQVSGALSRLMVR